MHAALRIDGPAMAAPGAAAPARETAHRKARDQSSPIFRRDRLAGANRSALARSADGVRAVGDDFDELLSLAPRRYAVTNLQSPAATSGCAGPTGLGPALRRQHGSSGPPT